MMLERRKIMNLGKKILKIRKDNKMSQDEFAETVNVTRQTVSNWENSKNYPDIETLIKISDQFNISLDILLKGDKKMINKIDKQVKDSKKLKILLIFFISLIVIISSFVIVNNYVKHKQEEKNNIKYEQIISNVNKLGFQKDEIGFTNIIENGVTYKIYIKRPQILEEHISATTEFTKDEMISATYDGKNLKVTYINEDNATVYCNKNGELENTNQNKNNIELYNKYKDKTIQIVVRMVELFDSVYK